MPKSYPQELRQKIIEEYFAGGISQRNLAKKHGVSKAWVFRLVRKEKLEKLEVERRAKRHLHIVKNSLNPEEG